MWREWPVIEWFYRTFLCPKRGHWYKSWYAFGLIQQPYCKHCGALQPGWEGPSETYDGPVVKEFCWKADS